MWVPAHIQSLSSRRLSVCVHYSQGISSAASCVAAVVPDALFRNSTSCAVSVRVALSSSALVFQISTPTCDPLTSTRDPFVRFEAHTSARLFQVVTASQLVTFSMPFGVGLRSLMAMLKFATLRPFGVCLRSGMSPRLPLALTQRCVADSRICPRNLKNLILTMIGARNWSDLFRCRVDG